jgi:Uma2 family endonuclease
MKMHDTIVDLALVTAEQLAERGDIGRSELVEGRIVTMSPTAEPHGVCELAFGAALREYARGRKLGRVGTGEVGVLTRRNPDSVRGADVVFVSYERLAQAQSRGYLDVAPDLVVEVLSPGDRWTDLIQKLREYFGIGVKVVWVADPAAHTVLAYKSLTTVREFGVGDVLTDEDVLPGFAVPVVDLFED